MESDWGRRLRGSRHLRLGVYLSESQIPDKRAFAVVVETSERADIKILVNATRSSER